MEGIEYTKEGIIVNGDLITLDEITENVNIAKIKDEKLGLLSFVWGGGRGWDGAYEYIVKPTDIIDELTDKMVNKQIYFGEIAGKHSEVFGDLDPEDIVVETDPKKVSQFLKKHPTGRDANHSFIDAYANHIEDDEEYKAFYKLLAPKA